ncbi:MAG: hypothetical protein IPG85_10030 [Bacteroidetes bacterium]|nr:hypothetical protein [Bacteroidota bacterium]
MLSHSTSARMQVHRVGWHSDYNHSRWNSSLCYSISGAAIDALGNATNLCAGTVIQSRYGCKQAVWQLLSTINLTKRTNDYD